MKRLWKGILREVERRNEFERACLLILPIGLSRITGRFGSTKPHRRIVDQSTVRRLRMLITLDLEKTGKHSWDLQTPLTVRRWGL